MTKIYATSGAVQELRDFCSEYSLPFANAMRDIVSGNRADGRFEIVRSWDGEVAIATADESPENNASVAAPRQPYRQPLWRFAARLPGAPSEVLLSSALLEAPHIPLYNPVTETYIGTREYTDYGTMKLCHGNLPIQDAVEFISDITTGDVIGTFSDIESHRWSDWYGDLKTDFWLLSEVEQMTAKLAHSMLESEGGWINLNIDDAALAGAQQLYRFCCDIGADEAAAKVQMADGEDLERWLRAEIFYIAADEIPCFEVEGQLKAGRSLWNPSTGSVFAPEGGNVLHMHIPSEYAGKLASLGDSPDAIVDLCDGEICLMPIADASALAASEGAGLAWINTDNKLYDPIDQAFDFCSLLDGCVSDDRSLNISRAFDSILAAASTNSERGSIERLIDEADSQSIASEWLLSWEDGPLRGLHSPEAYKACFDADLDGGLAEQKDAGTTFDSWLYELKRMDLVSPHSRPGNQPPSPSTCYSRAADIAGNSIVRKAGNQGESHVKL